MSQKATVIAVTRIVVSAAVLVLLGYLYMRETAAGNANPFDFFGYFTNLTSLLSCAVLIATSAFAFTKRQCPHWLTDARAVTVSCMIIVAVIYNTLVPGTGSAPPWASTMLHIVFPLWIVLDWAFVSDHGVMRWKRLWIALPYPLIWMGIVLTRGATDGWVPYGFLLPEHGPVSLSLHVAGLVLALLAAAALAWLVSRWDISGERLRRALASPASPRTQ